MAGLYKELEAEMRKSLKEGDSVRLSVLRMAVSDIKNLEIEKKVKELDDADVLKVLQRHVKQHKESIAQFDKGGRKDLVDKEAAELKILESYMPKQLGEEEITKFVKEAIAETGASLKNDLGLVMKAVMPKVQGKADGKTITEIVLRFLK